MSGWKTLITNNFLRKAFKHQYPQVNKNIIQKNYDFQIQKQLKTPDVKISIFNDDKVIYVLKGVIDIIDIDDRDDPTDYYQYFKITDNIPEELAHEHKIECFLCNGEGKIDRDYQFIDSYRKLLLDKSYDELIGMIKSMRNKLQQQDQIIQTQRTLINKFKKGEK